MRPLTVKEVAAQLRISLALAYALIARNAIRHERHGRGRGVIRVPPEALEDYRRRCERGAQTADPPPPPATVTPPRPPRPRHVRMKP